MKGDIRTWVTMIFLNMMCLISEAVYADGNGRMFDHETDTLPFARRIIHRIDIEARPGYIFPANPFLKGENEAWKPIKNTLSAHLRYSFRFRPDTYADRIYRDVYQGIGIARYSFGNSEELGDPIALYLFQGAKISSLASFLSFNYEWNFGLSAGWKPFDYTHNWYNKIIGTRINAYMNADFFLNWNVAPRFDLTTGVSLTHFSNGNTKFPNAGLNTVGLKAGLVYYVNRDNKSFSQVLSRAHVPAFPRHVSYDLVLFGSWRRKGVVFGDKQIPSPDVYPVAGFSFSPMYNLGYRIRAGASLDGFYDGSANVYVENFAGTELFLTPSLDKQLALGVSGRLEYVMPYFSVGIGLGANVLHGGNDLKALYQLLSLKIEVTRSSFIHIGYSLHDFHDPNFLMLGIGFRFNNKFPAPYR